MYDLVAPTLLDLSGLSVGSSLSGAQPQKAAGGTGTGTGGGGSNNGKGGKGDPIMQARAVACLAAAWPHVPSSPSTSSSSAAPGAEAGTDERSGAATVEARDAICNLQRAHAAPLTRSLSGALSNVVWSVRVPIYGALSAVVSRTTTAGSQTPVLTGSLLADLVQAVELGAKDAKYSQVCVQYVYVCLRTFLLLLELQHCVFGTVSVVQGPILLRVKECTHTHILFYYMIPPQLKPIPSM